MLLHYLPDIKIDLWKLINDPELFSKVKVIIVDADNSIYYSTVSPWEVEIKHLNNPDFQLSSEQLPFLCNQNGLLNLSVQNEHV